MTRIKLGDGKARALDSMIKTSFWSPDGKPISAEQFLHQLFGDLPAFFKSEQELRNIWSLPETRKRLIEELHEKGYSGEQLSELKKLVHGEDSDLFDVLSYVAFHSKIIHRLQRASYAKLHLDHYNQQQQDFINFVLGQYIMKGVEELDDSKLPDLLQLKYRALDNAKRELGNISTIRDTFISFQKHLYESKAG